MICPACGGDLPDDGLSCTHCRALIHGAKLEDLARRAKEAWRLGQFADERTLWSKSLALLPEETVQYGSIAARIAAIDAQLATAAQSQIAAKAPDTLADKVGFLVSGLMSTGTLLSMLVSFYIYGRMTGYRSAAGLIVAIYIHEMGHVAACLRYGIPASPPVFVPGLGAFISLRMRNIPPIVDSRIGLAGPIYGTGAAFVALGVYYLTHGKVWGMIAHEAAILNLLNLIPVWQLDGSRGIHSMTRAQRAIVVMGAAVLFAVFKVKMLLGIIGVCIYRLFTRDWPNDADTAAVTQYLWLMIALSAIVAASPSFGGFFGDVFR
jgi:Zn-dependent protease